MNMDRLHEAAVNSIHRAKNAQEAREIGESYAVMEEVCRRRPDLYDELYPPPDYTMWWIVGVLTLAGTVVMLFLS